MYKQTPSQLPYSPLKIRYNPHYKNDFMLVCMEMFGYMPEENFMPVIETFDLDLEYIALLPGNTQTQSLPSNDENWVCVDRTFTAVISQIGGQTFARPGLLKVSSWIQSAEAGQKITLCEDGPISLVFGSGEWQHSLLIPEKKDTINNRVWSVTNESPMTVDVTLNFKFVRIIKKEI